MDFRTKIDISQSNIDVNHKDQLMIFGSCFAENIGELLKQNKFSININPFGILYNPESIRQAIEIVISEKQFTGDDLFQHGGLYNSFYHHSRFSNQDRDQCIHQINENIKQAHDDLSQTKILFITFGTSYVYQLKETGLIVGNCHKIPANKFDRYKLKTEQITSEWDILIKKLKSVSPDIQTIFTVSPIRHFKDGAHENQLSKSTLLLAVDELCSVNTNTSYFPSYEIVLDELRDYRFYNDDMIHPNNTAIKYIWEKFGETYFSDSTRQIINEWKKLQTAIQHRPFNPNTDEHKHFLKQTLLRLKSFKNKYPYICCCKEEESLAHQTNPID